MVSKVKKTPLSISDTRSAAFNALGIRYPALSKLTMRGLLITKPYA